MHAAVPGGYFVEQLQALELTWQCEAGSELPEQLELVSEAAGPGQGEEAS